MRMPLGANPMPALDHCQRENCSGSSLRHVQVGDYPTAEYSFASSYSVKGMPFLCRAIANARPPIPAPVKRVRGVLQYGSRVDRLTDDGDVEFIMSSSGHGK